MLVIRPMLLGSSTWIRSTIWRTQADEFVMRTSESRFPDSQTRQAQSHPTRHENSNDRSK
jgi:hypothetical protein